MTLDFPTRLVWAWWPSTEAWVARLGEVRDFAVALDHRLPEHAQWRRGLESRGTDLRTAILAAEDEAIDLLCGALASLREPT